MKKKWLFLTILLGLLLAACASQPKPTAAPVAEEIDVSAPTAALPLADEGSSVDMENTEPATLAEPAIDNGSTTFLIVPGESTLTYEVGEVFLSQDNRFATAIGITSDISGTISLDADNPQNTTIGEIRSDISLFKSDSGKRDNAIKGRFLESTKYPVVIFNPTEILELPESYQLGDTVQFQVVGDTTIRETTLPLTFDVSVVFDGTTLSAQAGTTFLMSDFGFGPISIAGILNTEDEVKINIDIVARP